MSQTDRIEKELTLNAPLSRVWRALTDYEQFGVWFRVKLDSPFVMGQTTHGRITFPGYEHLTVSMCVEAIEPERLFAYRWHPYPNDPTYDYSQEPATLVEFVLTPLDDRTQLRICESGFDRLPAWRRDEAFRLNSQGWDMQTVHLADHLAT